MRGVVLAAALAVLGVSPASAASLHGVVPDVPTGATVPQRLTPRAAPTAHAASLNYEGGPVMHHNRVHVIFWQPSGSGLSFDPGYESLVDSFLSAVAADSHKPSNVYSLTGQYTDQNGPAVYDSSYAGAIVDSDPLPPNGCTEPAPPPLSTGPGWTVCLNSNQLDAEVDHVISSDHLPNAFRDAYVLATPRGFGSCAGSGPDDCAVGGSKTNGYCGYHTLSLGGVKYAVIPYNAVRGHCQSDNPRPNASTADPALSTLSHEHNEMITDPLGNAWLDIAGNEDGDLCITAFGPRLGGGGGHAYDEVIHGGHYYLQEEYSNDDRGCAARDESDRASFQVPSALRRGRRGRFIARARDRDGSIVGYTWFFGDGRHAGGRTNRHKFRRAGTYRVTLRVTDSSGNWAFATRTVRVR